MAPAPARVVALVSAYNEADIIGRTLQHLVEQGLEVHLLDDGSTDGTAEAARPWLGRGLLAIERLPPRPDGLFWWERVLERKQAIAASLPGRWFVHHDADEFRESPWPQWTLRQAIGQVDALGYDAIDFEVLNFPPTTAEPTADLSGCRHFERAQPCDRLQVKCWKQGERAVDLVSSGGHEAQFEGRRVFPIRFLLRHYPIRGQQQGSRKVFQERRGRFRPEERARGWHVQYDGLEPGHCFVADPARLEEYDPDRVRLLLFLRHRGVEALEAELGCARAEVVESARRAEAAERRTLELQHELRLLRESRTWRWSAPLRGALDILAQRRG